MAEGEDPLSKRIKEVIDVMAAHATTDDSAEMHERLIDAGVEPDIAVIVPDMLEEYCGNLVAKRLGVELLDTYTRPTPDGRGQITFQFSQHPVWRCIDTLVPEMIAQGEWHAKLGLIAQRSAIFNSVDSAIKAGSEVAGSKSATSFMSPDDEITSVDVSRWLPSSQRSLLSRWFKQ